MPGNATRSRCHLGLPCSTSLHFLEGPGCQVSNSWVEAAWNREVWCPKSPLLPEDPPPPKASPGSHHLICPNCLLHQWSLKPKASVTPYFVSPSPALVHGTHPHPSTPHSPLTFHTHTYSQTHFRVSRPPGGEGPVQSWLLCLESSSLPIQLKK